MRRATFEMGLAIYKSKYKMVGVLPIRIVQSNVSSIGPLSERNLTIYDGLSHLAGQLMH